VVNFSTQVATLQQQQQMLLRYAAQLARDKNALVQRTLELTERLNAAAAGNPETRAQLLDGIAAAAPLPAAVEDMTNMGAPDATGVLGHPGE
jgi:hypothetical protein